MSKWFILCLFLLISCNDSEGYLNRDSDRDYRQEMRWFVEGLSRYAKSIDPYFLVIPQNGHELLALDPLAGSLTTDYTYLRAIDGIGREDLFYGYDGDDVETPEDITREITPFLDLAEANFIEVLVTDYCTSEDNIDQSYSKSYFSYGYISFAADSRDLDGIPAYPAEPYLANNSTVQSLFDTRNFLYLINPANYSSKNDFINSITNTSYDLLIMDYFFDEDTFTIQEINNLREKSIGGERLLIAYMSIGEAEDYRYYWNNSWNSEKPSWLMAENPNWKGNYKVKYWDPEWQSVIYGNPDAYLDKIIRGGYDGVYLDIIDAYEYFEN